MKSVLLVGAALSVLVITPALAQSSHSVRGYTRKDGTYVAPHRATNPNSTRSDNWSTKGNVNPYTGKEGTIDPYASPSTTSSSTYPSYRSKKSSY
jgi:hypothetical protein